MKPFVSVAVLFVIPVVLKSYLLLSYGLLCGVPILEPYDRLLLPFLLAVVGYFIFILEGTQSSVILANKHSLETLNRILENIDISNRVRRWTGKALSRIIDGAKIDDFIIGRQLLIIALAFLFKLAYDKASLTPMEVQMLSAESQISCAFRPSWVLAIYSVLDNSLFSTFLCAVLVAYFFQVPSKLMAQYHPLRFLTTIPLAIHSPAVSQWLGSLSQLGRPLDALRKRGDARTRRNEFSYFSSREPSPVSTQQLFEALAGSFGEYVKELSVTLCPQSTDKQDTWFVEDETIYKVVRPNREFSQAIQVPKMTAFQYKVSAGNTPGKYTLSPLHTNEKHFNIASTTGDGLPEVLVRVYARFDTDQPVGGFVVWQMNYLTPVLTTPRIGGIPAKFFDIHVKKPVERVMLRVSGIACADPEVEILPVDGAEAPTYSNIERVTLSTSRGLIVNYPSIGSMLRFQF